MMPDLWVFGYGSLMWRPGFDFEACVPARLYGFHRSFCVYSHVHRGTPEKPGLVFGLDAGGSCRGLAFRVGADKAEATRAYLQEREQVTSVYLDHMRRVHLLEGDKGPVEALVFVVDRAHRQYAGKLDFDTQKALVATAKGRSGHNRDYLEQTVRHLEEIGVHDAGLARLWRALA